MSSTFPTRRSILRLGGAALAATAGCLGGRSSADRTVAMAGGLAFEPKTVTIDAGRTVTWSNDSDVEHTVTAYEDRIPDGAAYFASGGFDSERAARNHTTEGLVAPGGEYEHTFERPGTYEYYCIPHEGSGMVATVGVR